MDPIVALLPPFLDPVFDFLEDKLPPPVYFILVTVLSNAVALVSTSIRLIANLLQKDPQEWDMQTVLPPVVTLLAAYLALASLYRTTTWMLRLSFWFVKWGSLLGALCLGAGWFAAVASMNGDPKDALANLGSKAAGWFNGNTDGTTTTSSTRTRTPPQRNSRPWSNFDTRHRDQASQGIPQANLEEAQKVMQNIVERANWWWQAGMVMVGGGDSKPADEAPQRQQRGQTRSR